MKKVLFAVAVALLMTPSTPALAATWNLPFVDVAQLSVNQGKPVAVTFGVLSSSTCSVWLQSGTFKSKAKSYKVSRPQKSVSVPTTGLRTGKYDVRVSCGASGKAGKGVSDPVWIVPKGAVTTATCGVADKGFSVTKVTGVSYGLELKNLSPVLTATTVAVRVSFLNSSGVTLSSARILPMDIAPGESIYTGGTQFGEGITSISVETSCDSSLDQPTPRLRGSGAGVAIESPIYLTRISGLVTNSTAFTIAEYSPLSYLIRDSSGAITGGGSTSLGLILLPQGKGSWKADSYADLTNIGTVSWVLDPMKDQ